MSKVSREREKKRHEGQKVLTKEEFKAKMQYLDLLKKPIKISWPNENGQKRAFKNSTTISKKETVKFDESQKSNENSQTTFKSSIEIKNIETELIDSPNRGGDRFINN